MPRAKKDPATRVNEVAAGWLKERPKKKFSGLTLDDYRLAIRPYTDALAEIADLEARLERAKSKRDMTEGPAMKVTKRVVAAVVGDPDEGEDGHLYAAMGYVPASQRSTGLVRRKKNGELAPAPQVQNPG